jgi:exopolysaccharide biosynthesis WecB/TagA/CpsF family protein
MDQAAEALVQTALRKRELGEQPFYSTSANGNILALCHRDIEFRALMLKTDEIDADGMPLVMFSKFFAKHPLPERVATTDLVKVVAARAEKLGVSFYFLGGPEDINSEAVARMRREYPNLIFKGRHHGYFRPDEEDAIIAEIAACRPDILWVGLGVPLEQQFVNRNLERLRGVGVVKTCGGLFEFLSGNKRRAPKWMQSAGLEWAHRMMLEPGRLTRRYVTTNAIALCALILRSRHPYPVPPRVAMHPTTLPSATTATESP